MNTTKITYNSLYSSLLVLFIFFGFSLLMIKAGDENHNFSSSCYVSGNSLMVITTRGGVSNYGNGQNQDTRFYSSQTHFLTAQFAGCGDPVNQSQTFNSELHFIINRVVVS